MVDRKYFAERIGIAEDVELTLDQAKKIFRSKYLKMKEDLFFLQATGYKCVDGADLIGLWGDDVNTFFLMELKLVDLWPIEEKINDYDEPTFFSIVEFLSDYVSKAVNPQFHPWDNCGWHCKTYNKKEGLQHYITEINGILKKYKEGYKLTDKGEIIQVPFSGLESLLDLIEETDDPESIDKRIEHAVSKYLRHSSTLSDKKDAVRALADVLEFFRHEDIKFDKKDDGDLFQIMNNFDLRHHRRDQQGDYSKEMWYEWLFYTFLASINLLIKRWKEK